MLNTTILAALAVFGFTYIVRYMDGPFDILKRFRMLAGLRYINVIQSNEEIEEIRNTMLAKLVGCFWCLTTWVSITFNIIMTVYMQFTVIDWLFSTFACIAISGVLHSFVVRSDA